MNENQGLLSSGLARVGRNKRYILWFWLLNLTLAEAGTAGFRRAAHAILDHSLYSQHLTDGFSLSVFIELLAKPDFGIMRSMTVPALYLAIVFFLATALFLPGVFLGYSSNYRLPREEFFRACGRNLWRFIRLMIIAGIVMAIFTGVLFGINGAIVKKAGESTNELLPFELQMTGLTIIFLIMCTLRIWFDLAEADIVLSDQRAVRKSIWTGLKHTLRSLPRLLVSYVIATIVAAIILVGGLWIWIKFVSPASILGAFLVAQIMLFLLLIPRFWQRGVAVSYWQKKMLVPAVATQPIVPTPQLAFAVPGAPATDQTVSSPPTEGGTH
jgi:uncharacterized membrane protein